MAVFKVITILILTALPVVASTSDRVVVRESISAENRDELADRLRAITGWSELSFSDDGALRIGDAIERGSRSARDLINRAVSGNRIILFEDASSRKDVVFCRVVLGKLLQDTAGEFEVNIVMIDFDDFRQVIGDKQARAAFDVGWAVLHEIDHVVSDSRDPDHDTSLGECETHINQMRRELGLPTRNSYFFSFLPVKNDANLVSRFVRLGFDHVNYSSTKRNRYWLIWDAAIVGGLNPDCFIALTVRH
jgi:hypothetical protein